jgi:hypothetical protein
MSSDDYRSDLWILDLFGEDQGYFDPCPFKAKDQGIDGLSEDWSNARKIYVNPPYSEPHKWIDKALQTLFDANMRNQEITIVMLLKHDSSTRWFRKLHEAGAHFLLVSERLSYQTGKPANFPSIIAILSNVGEVQ